MSGPQLTAPELLSLCFGLLIVLSEIRLGHAHGPVVVKEGSDALLNCSLGPMENIKQKFFDWRKIGQKNENPKEVFLYDAGIHYNNGRPGQDEQFKGRVFHFPNELDYGNASIIIRNAKEADSGNYTCDFHYLNPRQTFQVELLIDLPLKDRSGENPAAIPEPYIRTLDATEDWELLQCEVRGAFPKKPHLQWQDSAGKQIHAEEPQVSYRDGRYYATLNATVTKTDRYRCVVTQEDIKHQTHAETSVHISVCEDSSSKVAIGWLGGLVLGAFIIFAVQALLVAAKVITIRCNKGSRQQENGSCHQGNGSRHQGNSSCHQGNGSRHQGNGSYRSPSETLLTP